MVEIPFSEMDYDEALEAMVLQISMQEADSLWPEKKDFNANFVVPIFGASDAYKTQRVLREGDKNEKVRRLKLSEFMKICRVLGKKPHNLLSDAEFALDNELRKPTG